MGRARRVASRKPLATKDPNLPHANLSAQQKLLIDMNHRELERRIAAIRAIRDASIERILTQLRLAQSKLPHSVLDMPLTSFLKLYCPNTEAVILDSGVIELKKRNAAVNRPGCFSYSKDLPFGFNFTAAGVKEHLLQSVDKIMQQDDKNEEWSKYNASYMENQVRESSLQTPKTELIDQSRIGLTPRTERLPKPGEVLLSINGSPLGLYGNDGLTSIPEERPRRTRRKLHASAA